MAFSPKENIIASASFEGTVKLWNFDGEELKTLNGHNGWVTSVAWSSDGKTLASNSDDDGTLILWNLEDLELKQLLKAACEQAKDYLEHNAEESEKDLCD